MTLADIISDCFDSAGLSEMVEQAADEVVSEIFNGNNMRHMLADMVRDAMREKKADIEDAILEQLQEAVDDAVADFVS